MNPFAGIGQAWHWSVRKVLSRWMRATVKPDEVAAAILRWMN